MNGAVGKVARLGISRRVGVMEVLKKKDPLLQQRVSFFRG